MAVSDEAFIDAQEVLRGEAAAAYDYVFGDQYWWGTPETPPIRPGLETVKANRMGASLLKLYPEFNGGMLRLGAPSLPAEDVVDADDNPRGTILATIEEIHTRSLGLRSASDPHLTTAIGDNHGFSVIRYYGRDFASYRQEVKWWASAETRAGGLAFFPLEVDDARSYSSGLNDSRYNPALKVIDYETKGHKEIPVGVTVVSPGKVADTYSRYRNAALHQPVSTPQPKHWEPDDYRL